MENGNTILDGYSDLEKGAYLGAIASIATADREASEEEMEHISELCDAAELTETQKQFVLRAATELTGEDLNRCLDVLKTSELRFSLVADLIAFAKSDENYSTEEEESIQKISKYLGLDKKQFSLLDEFSDKAASSGSTPEEMADPSYLSSTDMKDKMESAGINTGSLLKGLLGIAGPMILAGMLSGGMRRRGGGMFGGGGGLGGMLGGGMGGGMLGGGMMGGGLGSIIGMLSGGRGFGSTGGLFGRMFGGRRY